MILRSILWNKQAKSGDIRILLTLLDLSVNIGDIKEILPANNNGRLLKTGKRKRMNILIKCIITFAVLTVMQIANADFADKLDGIWEGEGRSSVGRPQKWSIRLSAQSGNYKIDYPSLSCSGSWSLLSVTNGSASFFENIDIGKNNCVDQGTVDLIWLENNKLKYIYYLPNGNIEAFAELSCPSCNININIPMLNNALYIPNFDSSSRIITFPKIKVDNSKTYINAQLLLREDGKWDILAIEPEPELTSTPVLNLTGTWTGLLGGPGDFGVPLPSESIEVSLIQNGNRLLGVGIVHSNCSVAPCGIRFFTITGAIDEKNISFEFIFDANSESLTGTISDDFHILSGLGSMWFLSLQE